MQAIGLIKKGFILRLEKAAKLLPSLPIQVHVPVRQLNTSYELQLDWPSLV